MSRRETTVENTIKPRVFRFNTLATASNFRWTAETGYAVLLGDDELFWVGICNDNGKSKTLS